MPDPGDSEPTFTGNLYAEITVDVFGGPAGEDVHASTGGVLTHIELRSALALPAALKLAVSQAAAKFASSNNPLFPGQQISFTPKILTESEYFEKIASKS